MNRRKQREQREHIHKETVWCSVLFNNRMDARPWLAAALLKAGHREQAIEQLKLVLKLQPNNQPAKQELEILSGGEKQP